MLDPSAGYLVRDMKRRKETKAMINKLFDRITGWLRDQDTMRVLHQMSDRDLAKIGLLRSQIGDAVRR